jgi:hypothetical protein
MHTSFSDSYVLGKFNDDCEAIGRQIDARTEELNAAHERIAELKSSLAEMLGIYWGEGDGEEPAPACIQRAQAALNEEVR